MDELERIKKEKIKKLIEKAKGGKMQTEIEANDADFQEQVIEQSKQVPVLVDFWAQWCGPCVMLSPLLEKLAKDYNGKFILAKVNVDEARAAAQTYGIMSIPSVKLFKNGQIVAEFVGVQPETMIKEWLDRNI